MNCGPALRARDIFFYKVLRVTANNKVFRLIIWEVLYSMRLYIRNWGNVSGTYDTLAKCMNVLPIEISCDFEEEFSFFKLLDHQIHYIHCTQEEEETM